MNWKNNHVYDINTNRSHKDIAAWGFTTLRPNFQFTLSDLLTKRNLGVSGSIESTYHEYLLYFTIL